MAKSKVNISATVDPKNKKYIEDQVAEKQKTNSRYCFSHWVDDLVTHLRLKAENDKQDK